MIRPSTVTFRERIELLLVEEINKNSKVLKEPETFLPKFIEDLSLRIVELAQDEIRYGRR